MNSVQVKISPKVLLLALLIFSIYGVPFLPSYTFTMMYQILFSSVMFSCVFVLKKKRRFNLIASLIVIGLKWGILLYNAEWRNISNIPQVVFFIYIVGSLLVQIASTRQSTASMVMDCLNGYFLSALASALLIGLTAFFSPGSFNFPHVGDSALHGMNDYIYYAIVVFSTTGFGDIIPVTPQAKSVSNFTSVTGQLYVAIVITLLIGHHTTKNIASTFTNQEEI